jgi:hypothetical protein
MRTNTRRIIVRVLIGDWAKLTRMQKIEANEDSDD